MKLTVIINLKIIAYLLLTAGMVGALSTYVLPVSGATIGAALTLVGFALLMFWAGTRLQGYFDDRIIRHYWLTQGYNTEAADKKVVEFGETARDSIRAGTFFKEYGP